MTLPAYCSIETLPTDRTNDEPGKHCPHGRSPERTRRHPSPGGVPDRRRQARRSDPAKARASRARASPERARPAQLASRCLYALSYGRHADCERLLANIRELIAGPAMGGLGDNDEDEAEKQMAAREPKVQ